MFEQLGIKSRQGILSSNTPTRLSSWKGSPNEGNQKITTDKMYGMSTKVFLENSSDRFEFDVVFTDVSGLYTQFD